MSNELSSLREVQSFPDQIYERVIFLKFHNRMNKQNLNYPLSLIFLFTS